MTEPTVNIPLLRKAVEWAEAEAAMPSRISRWNQGAWVINPVEIQRDEACGTCYCIAGFVVSQESTVAPVTDKWWQVMVDDAIVDEYDFCSLAASRLGIDRADANRLFNASNSIEDVRIQAESIAGESL